MSPLLLDYAERLTVWYIGAIAFLAGLAGLAVIAVGLAFRGSGHRPCSSGPEVWPRASGVSSGDAVPTASHRASRHRASVGASQVRGVGGHRGLHRGSDRCQRHLRALEANPGRRHVLTGRWYFKAAGPYTRASSAAKSAISVSRLARANPGSLPDVDPTRQPSTRRSPRRFGAPVRRPQPAHRDVAAFAREEQGAPKSLRGSMITPAGYVRSELGSPGGRCLVSNQRPSACKGGVGRPPYLW